MDIKDIVANLVVNYYSGYSSMLDDLIHTQQVVTYTRMIATAEGYNDREISLLEAAAWLHDIGCPKSREIYGNSLPVNQQTIGKQVALELLADIDTVDKESREWLAMVVATHHQFKSSQELKFIPLFEADLIVNILSGYYAADEAAHLYNQLMTTSGGKKLFKVLIR